MSSTPLTTLRLSWPRDVTADQQLTAIHLLVQAGGRPMVLEALGQAGQVQHLLRVQDSHRSQLTRQLRTAIPGLGIETTEAPSTPTVVTKSVELRLTTKRRPLRTDDVATTSRALLAALSHVGKDERCSLQWTLQRRTAARAVPSKIASLPDEKWWKALLQAPLGVAPPADADTRAALRDKHQSVGVLAVGHIAAAASPSRANQLIRSVLAALRTAEGPGVQITARTTKPGVCRSRSLMHLNASELATLSAWPIGPTADLPVVRLGSRRLPIPAGMHRTGRVVGRATWPGRARALTLAVNDSLRHLHVVGPTGTGKSTLLLHLIDQDIDAGRAVVVIEPKGDLIRDVLARVPKSRTTDVVLIDPTDPEAVVGLNPLAVSRASRELVADQLLATFHGLYAQHWGPRTSDILHAALLTLARSDSPTIVALPLLLSDPSFRRRLVGQLSDPIGLGPFWAQFEAWSEAERVLATAPVLNKLRPFLMRPTLRRTVGQSTPKFQMLSLFTERKIVLVNVAKGQLGPEAASLLGALVLSSLWQTALTRTGIDPSRRHPVMVYIDEFQDYLHLPTDLADALTQARGLGIGFTLAHQHLGQLEPSLRAAVLANVRSRVCFQLGSDDARVFAGTSTLLGAEDFASLDTFHFYAQLTIDGAVAAWTSGQSHPAAAPQSSRHARIDDVIAASRRTYATPLADIDADLQRLVTGRSTNQRPASSNDLAPKRRKTGGAA